MAGALDLDPSGRLIKPPADWEPPAPVPTVTVHMLDSCTIGKEGYSFPRAYGVHCTLAHGGTHLATFLTVADNWPGLLARIGLHATHQLARAGICDPAACGCYEHAA